jgi:hypothetical protein
MHINMKDPYYPHISNKQYNKAPNINIPTASSKPTSNQQQQQQPQNQNEKHICKQQEQER